MRRAYITASAAVLAIAIAGCGGNKGTDGTSSGLTINGAGATFPYPIYTKWFQAYQGQHPGVTFNYQGVGSGAGIAQYQAGTVDFAGTDVPLTAAEEAALPQPTIHIPTVAGSVVLAYNIKGVGPGLKLSGDVIADIYLGKVKSWNDPRIAGQNAGMTLPAAPITVAHRSDGSGTTNIFTTYLSAVSPEWKTKVGSGKSVSWPAGLGGSGNPGVAGLIKNSEGTIGYVELAYAKQNALNYGPVRNRDGQYVEATSASTTAAANAATAAVAKDVKTPIANGAGATTYPICGFTYLLVPRQPKDAAKGKELAAFLEWAMGPGQDLAPSLLYAPLPAALVALNRKAIAGMGPGAK